MPTYTFDDGSTITNDETPTGWTTSATAATDNGIAGWADSAEAAKLNQFYPQGGGEWWQQAAAYGFTRAVDAHFAPSSVDKTMTPGTYAGQNGKTYAGGAAGAGLGGNPLLLLLLAAGAFVALS